MQNALILLNKIKSSHPELYSIGYKVIHGIRIDSEEAMALYTDADISFTAFLAHFVRTKINGNKVYFIKNVHIEYTNICINKCVFCSFRSKTAKDSWELNHDEILERIRKNISNGIKEVHIVGGIHPDKDIYFWLAILKNIRKEFPHLHIKAFTAPEIDYITRKAGLTIETGLKLLKENGLDSIPGGGAEIFNNDIRHKLFPTKIDWQQWLLIHKTAHKMGIPSNATMLYGHIEHISDRIFHLSKLRALQDETSGFNAFIPLKFKNKNNDLKGIKESTLHEDLKMFALSRIFLDNFKHIKAYWPMLGKETALLALDFGADDLDGTINNSTAIYSKAGATEQKPQFDESEIIKLIQKHRKRPVERNGAYE